MIYTISCIVCTTLLGALFKWSERYKSRAVAIIPINYFICFIIGFLHAGPTIFQEFSTWLPYSIVLGCLFIIGFSVFAKSIQIAGLPTATLFQKMSIILTVIAAIFMGDSMNIYQFIGLFIGIISIFFIQNMKSKSTKQNQKYFGYLIGILIISSCIEIIFMYVDKRFHFNSQLKLIFPSYIFLVAGILGFLLLGWTSGFSITKSEMIFGILLGIPNFYSIYFLMMALDGEMIGSIFFPVLNCSVITLAAVMGVFLFKDKLNKLQYIGITLSMVSIFLIFYFKK